MPFNIQGPELILILIIALIVIGPGKLPEVGAALGKSIREFRKASSDVRESTSLEARPSPSSTSGTPPPVPTAAPPGGGPPSSGASASTPSASTPSGPATSPEPHAGDPSAS